MFVVYPSLAEKKSSEVYVEMLALGSCQGGGVGGGRLSSWGKRGGGCLGGEDVAMARGERDGWGCGEGGY